MPSSVLPSIVPLLAVLGLLALPRNRNPGAWWIWGAFVCTYVFQALLRSAEESLPGQPIGVFCDANRALSFGLACLWLIARPIERKSRFRALLLMLATVAGLGMAAYLLGVFEEQSTEIFIGGVVALMCGLIIPVTLALAGLSCRRVYRPGALVAWSAVWAMVFTALLVSPFLVMALMANPNGVLWNEFLIGSSLLAGTSLLILAPFLVLAFCNELFRDRLKSLLRFGGTEKPTMLSPGRTLELEPRGA